MKTAELTPKDLMVGDWVIPHVYDSKLEPSKIVGVHYNSYKGKDYVDWVDCEVWDELSLSDIEPIPLTPEILKKNGFGYKEGGFGMYGIATVPHYVRDDVPFEIFCDGEPFAIWFKEPINIKYVHQLQHALRLCGIEKEITL